MPFYSQVGCVSLLGLFLCISDLESMRTLKNVAVQRGGSVTIPCRYDEQYKANPKFWCKGYYWRTCTPIAYANSTGCTTVTDYPSQNIFTVTLKPISDSGTRWCAAKPNSMWKPYDRDHLHLMVSQDPDLSVVESIMKGDEGGTVTIQCLYSTKYQKTQKQWCRFRDEACYTVGRTETSQNSALSIRDDGRSSFSVQMIGLKKSDAGWYWCRAGDLQVPVHISVSALAQETTESCSKEPEKLVEFCIAHN